MELSNIDFLTSKHITSFKNKGICTTDDLLYLQPVHYCYPLTFESIIEGSYVSILGSISQIYRNYNKNNTTCTVTTKEGHKVTMTWFNDKYAYRLLTNGSNYLFYGKISFNDYSKCWQITNPMFEKRDSSCIKVIYKKIKGISEDIYNKVIQISLEEFNQKEKYSSRILEKFNLPTQRDAFTMIHQPKSQKDVDFAKKYFLFDELFSLALSLQKWSPDEVKNEIRCTKMSSVPLLLKMLPFTLTDGPDSQLETIRNIVRRINKGTKTNSLIQGDVGSGKTIVAIILMLIMAENGFQSVMMAPTNILARQHYSEIVKLLNCFDFISAGLLTGDMKAAEKKEILKKIESGEINLIIGTHAVLSKSVSYKNLGLSIIDEEHRFGVKQRETIAERYKNIHTVIMSATPIPRTLGIVMYGSNTNFYTIKQMPAGRKKIITNIITDKNAGYEKIYDEIKKGHQAYVVCPLVEESTSEKMAEVTSINEAYSRISKYFSFDPHVKIGVISGQLKPSELSDEIDKFLHKEYQILIATTVVEVGVNVPNATIIMIENSERFGLSQLHQLRGRVGRNSLQSFCLLNTQKADIERLSVMTKTTNGFEIAQADVKLRGVGDLSGTKQCGIYDNVVKMLENIELYQQISSEVHNMIQYMREYEMLCLHSRTIQ